MDIVELHGDILQPGGQLETPGLVSVGLRSKWLSPEGEREGGTNKRGTREVFRETRPGVSSCPPGFKISPYNSKVSIEQNLDNSKNFALVEAIKT